MYEKQIESQNVFAGKIMNVRKDVVELVNGNTGEREIVELAGGVCVLPLKDDGNVVLVKQFRYAFDKVLLELPAGKLEPSEDPFETGKRELLEETGYSANRYDFLGVMYPAPGCCTDVTYMYLARELVAGQCSPDVDEFLEVVEIPFAELVSMVCRDEVPDAKTQLAVLKAEKLLR